MFAVADSYGFDRATCHAMYHVESITETLEKKGLTWDDVPEKLPLEELLPEAAGQRSRVGEVVLQLAQYNSGLGKILIAYDDPEQRAPILNAYRQCLEVAQPGETMSYTGLALYQMLTKNL